VTFLSNPNAFAAALTAVFVWVIDRALAHWGVVDLSPDQVLLAAGGLTTVVLWVGREGVKGAALRVWSGAKAVAGVKQAQP
jgi:hypothetical protein